MLTRLNRSSALRSLVARKAFSTAEVAATEQPAEERSIEEHNRRVGADVAFSESKHGYVLTFPWNFEQVISEFESDYRTSNKYWQMFMNHSRAVVDFNNLFRDFHQACAIPDKKGLERICEPRLASYVNESLQRIHYHGLDVEMANLTVEQPHIKVLKAEVHQGLSVDSSQNGKLSDY